MVYTDLMKFMVVYSFRTFPRVEPLSENVFIFSKLKENLEVLKQRIGSEQPKYLIGVAASSGLSRVEPVAINKFNQNPINKHGKAELNLFVPEGTPFQPSKSPTYSFCNWTMYKLQEEINDRGYHTKLIFFHIKVEELGKLTSWLFTLPG